MYGGGYIMKKKKLENKIEVLEDQLNYHWDIICRLREGLEKLEGKKDE